MGMFTDALKDGLGSGEKFRLKDGENQIRVLSEPKMLESTFNGKMSRKWLTWIIDRKEEKPEARMKLFYMPKTILKAIADYEDNAFYKFEGAPMPYDIIIKAKGAGTIDVEYTVMASPKREELSAEELELMKTLKPIEEVLSKILAAQAGGDSEPAMQQAA
jgi:hypothetical protein